MAFFGLALTRRYLTIGTACAHSDAASGRSGGGRKGRSSWNDEQIKKLRRMWLSGSTDADLINEFGRSANAIAIKAHRLGLPPRAEAVATNAIDELPPEAPKRADAVDYPDEDYGDEPRPQKPKSVGRVRNCLMCGVEFWSSHAGERICSSCKSTEFWRNGAYAFGHGGADGDDW